MPLEYFYPSTNVRITGNHMGLFILPYFPSVAVHPDIERIPAYPTLDMELAV